MSWGIPTCICWKTIKTLCLFACFCILLLSFLCPLYFMDIISFHLTFLSPLCLFALLSLFHLFVGIYITIVNYNIWKHFSDFFISWVIFKSFHFELDFFIFFSHFTYQSHFPLSPLLLLLLPSPHWEIKILCTWNINPYCLIFWVVENAMYIFLRQKESSIRPKCVLTGYINNWPENIMTVGQWYKLVGNNQIIIQLDLSVCVVGGRSYTYQATS